MVSIMKSAFFEQKLMLFFFFNYFSKFVVYTSLLIFVILFNLRLDEFIKLPYVYVFLPIWIWKGLVIVGRYELHDIQECFNNNFLFSAL